MNHYTLNTQKNSKQVSSTSEALRKLFVFLKPEWKAIIIASGAIILSSFLTLLAPFLIGYAINNYIQLHNFHGVVVIALWLLGVYLITLVMSYAQTKLMGGVGQRMLYALRNAVFNKLQDLPIAFFNQNKAGDLISRINNDTDNVNTFFSQSLMRFLGSLVTMVGAGIFLVSINWRLGLLALVPAVIIIVITRIVSPWVKQKSATSLRSFGNLSAEIQESLDNFKVIVAFNRRDYFKSRFGEINTENYHAAIASGLASSVFTPLYGLAANMAQLIVVIYGVYLIIHGQFLIGFLVSFLSYVSNLYDPLRQMAALWSSFQTAMAGWDRISEILAMENNLTIIPKEDNQSSAFLEFKNVSFAYEGGKQVFHDVNLVLERGKTYALVGPTGGGKTTTASLMARLYDASTGSIFLDGQDVRSYTAEERTKKIGFILQEPFLFTGTVRENIVYGNDDYQNHSPEELTKVLEGAGLHTLLERFPNGLETKLTVSGDGISLGQRQLIAFMRAVLRKPELLILDEATANIDTITEVLLGEILEKLPKTTTRVIIAHRLNTIENADAIFFVNGGEVTLAGSMEHALEMLLSGKRTS